MRVNYFNSRVKGITFRRAGQNINDYHNGMFLKFELDNNNPYDSNAIKIIDSFGNFIGYVGRDVNITVRKIISTHRYYCVISNVYSSYSTPSIEFSIVYECFNGIQYDDSFELKYKSYNSNTKNDVEIDDSIYDIFGSSDDEKCEDSLASDSGVNDFAIKDYENYEDDDVNNMIDEACDYFSSFYYERAYDTFSILAAKKNKVCEFFCGMYYLEGYFHAKNYELAFESFKRAYEHGHKYSCFYIGWMYENGYYVDKNLQIAIEYYEKAVELEIDEAKFRLASIAYFDGEDNKHYSAIEEVIDDIVDEYNDSYGN